MITDEIVVDGVHMVRLLGTQDHLLATIEREVPDVRVHVRGNRVTLQGASESVAAARILVEELVLMVHDGVELGDHEVVTSARMLRDGNGKPADVLTEPILTARGRTIRPKTIGQQRYVDAIDDHTIVFGIGPAGTGKTYLAMAKAVQALQLAAFERQQQSRERSRA